MNTKKRLYSQTNFNHDEPKCKKMNKSKEKVVQVCGGHGHILILTQMGKVYSIGRNDHGQLGSGDNINKLFPFLINSIYFNNEKIVQVCCACNYSMALSQNGHVYSWGYGFNGRLGHGDESNKNVAHKINDNFFNKESIKLISMGLFFSFALTKTNKLYAWGENCDGQLSLGNDIDQFKPMLVDSNTYNNECIIKIACGHHHTLLLTKKQNSNSLTNIYACGSNYSGQLGMGITHDINLFQPIDSNYFEKQKIKDIKSGGHFSFALVETNNSNETKIYSWGHVGIGRMELGDSNNKNRPFQMDSSLFSGKVIQISNGSLHLFAITKQQGSNEKKVFTWGGNENGQLGLGHFNNHFKPIEINMNCFKKEQIISIDGNNSSWGNSFAVTKTGKLFVCGHNRHRELGFGHRKNINVPQLFCPDLFGNENKNSKIYNNQSFEDIVIEYD